MDSIRDTLLDIRDNKYSDWIDRYNECVAKFDKAIKLYNDNSEKINNLMLNL